MPLVTKPPESAAAGQVQPPNPPKEKRGRKLVIYVPEAVYRAMAVRGYQRGERIERLAEEILTAKFSE